MVKRPLTLDVFDYSGHLVINLYDSSKTLSGEAFNIHKTDERNGWKELSFSLPSVCQGENGEEENYRLQYLIADYKIRFKTDTETDWFIISEPKITHNNFSKNIDVRAGHISQLLKTKKLSLEFSDEEGNNVGTAREFLECILEGTDWHVGNVAEFLEEDILVERNGEMVHPVKYRTLTAGSKTGAFKLIENMCDLFEAKPVYHGDTQTVDILPMNPFSNETEEGQIPEEVINHNANVLELHYERNIKDVSRTINAENIVTKLYGYGSYGDRNGLCSLQTASHEEFTYELLQAYLSGTEMCFTDAFGATYYFVVDRDMNIGDKLVWSRLDFASRSYIWDENYENEDETLGHAYHLRSVPVGNIANVIELDNEEVATMTADANVQNLFPYVFDFRYYDKIGLFTEEMFQEVAKYQRNMRALYDESIDKASIFINDLNRVSDVGNPQTGFLRLKAVYTRPQDEPNNQDSQDKTSTVLIDWDDTDPNDPGVIYRSDYSNARKNYFSWRVAKQLKANGDPVSGSPSYVLIAHHNGEQVDGQDTEHITWEKAWVKEIYAGDGTSAPTLVTASDGTPGDFNYKLQDENIFPKKLVLWAPMSNDGRSRPLPAYTQGDEIFLFCSRSNSGKLGALESQDETLINIHIRTATATATEDHPVYFMDGRQDRDTVPDLSVAGIAKQYGWYYKYYFNELPTIQDYKFGKLYFCGPDDSTWYPMYIGQTFPTNSEFYAEFEVNITNNCYYFDTAKRLLYCYVGSWIELESDTMKRITEATSQVIMLCKQRDRIYKGIYEKYYHRITGLETGDELTELPVGRYLIPNEFGAYWAFTTTEEVNKNKWLYVDTANKYVYQNYNSPDTEEESVVSPNIVTATNVNEEVISFMPETIVNKDDFSIGWINPNTGAEESIDYFNGGFKGYRSPYIKVYPGETYYVDMPLPTPSEQGYYGFIMFYDSALNKRSLLTISHSSSIEEVNGRIVGSFRVPTATTIDVSDPGYMPDAENIRIAWSGSAFDDANEQVYDMSIQIKNYQHKAYLNDNSKLLYTTLSVDQIGGDLLGLNNLMAEFLNKANKCYLESLIDLQTAQNAIKQADMDLLETLGLVLREGYWQDNSYVEGDEAKLYRDALKNLNEIAKPQISYSISFLDEYGSNKNIGYSVDGVSDDVEYPDVQITDAAHLIDPAIDTDCWAYIDKVDKCYDKPWETQIEINTRLSLIGQHDFTDVLSSIAEVAKMTKSQQSMYQKAAQFAGIDTTGYALANAIDQVEQQTTLVENDTTTVVINGETYQAVVVKGSDYKGAQIDFASLAGAIVSGVDISGAVSKGWSVSTAVSDMVQKQLNEAMEQNNLKFSNSTSKWHVDDKTGGIIFETADDSSALMISGCGFSGATERNSDGSWHWTLFGTGAGLIANSITSGDLNVQLLKAGSITTDKLSADSGQLLSITSNKGLDLYSTTDGSKPAGALQTTDAMIEIHSGDPSASKNEDKYGQVNILSGGIINLKAGRHVEKYPNQDSFPSYPTKESGETDEQYASRAHSWVGELRYDESTDTYYEWIYASSEPPESGHYQETKNNGWINIESNRNIKVQAGASIDLKAGETGDQSAEINVESAGKVNVKYGGSINLEAESPVIRCETSVDRPSIVQRQTLNGFPSIETYSTYSSLPSPGSAGTIYYVTDTAFTYKYEDGQYVIVEEITTYYYATDTSTTYKYKNGEYVVAEPDGKIYYVADTGTASKYQNGQYVNAELPKINIGSTGEIDIQSNGLLRLASGGNDIAGGRILIETTGSIDMNAGSKFTIGVGSASASPQDQQAAQLNVLSTGEVNIEGGSINVIGGLNGGDPGKIDVSSTGEININSEGNLNIGTNVSIDDYEFYATKSQFPAEGNVDKYYYDDSTNITWRWNPEAGQNGDYVQYEDYPTMRIGSAGRMNILANGVLTLSSSGSHGGRIVLEAASKMDLKAGSIMNIGVGTGVDPAKLNVSSTGEINIVAGGTLNLKSPNTPGYNGGVINVEANSAMNLSGGSINVNSGSSINVNANGDININNGGDINVEASGKINVKSNGAIKVVSNGALNVEGGSINITSNGHMDITSGTLSINTDGAIDIRTANFTVDSENKKVTSGNFSIVEHGFVLDKVQNTDHYSNIQSHFVVGDYDNMNLFDHDAYAGILYKNNIGELVDRSTGQPLYSYIHPEINIFGYREQKNETTHTLKRMFNIKISSDMSNVSIYNEPLNSSPSVDIGTYHYPFGACYFSDIYNPGGGGSIGDSSEFFGDIYVTNVHSLSNSSISSKEYKHNIKPIELMGDTLDKLKPVAFVYNKDKKERTRYGLIYEDTIDVLPNICVDYEDSKSIEYTDLISILLKEIQDLRKRVKNLEEA